MKKLSTFVFAVVLSLGVASVGYAQAPAEKKIEEKKGDGATEKKADAKMEKKAAKKMDKKAGKKAANPCAAKAEAEKTEKK